MTPYDMGKASCVSWKWRYTIRNPVFWRNACLKGWQVMSLEVLNMDLLLLISLISDYGAFLWSSLERLKTIRYFNQNTTAHGGKCGSYGQGCDLTVSTTISYFIALFPALRIDQWPVMVKFFYSHGFFFLHTNFPRLCDYERLNLKWEWQGPDTLICFNPSVEVKDMMISICSLFKGT